MEQVNKVNKGLVVLSIVLSCIIVLFIYVAIKIDVQLQKIHNEYSNNDDDDDDDHHLQHINKVSLQHNEQQTNSRNFFEPDRLYQTPSYICKLRQHLLYVFDENYEQTQGTIKIECDFKNVVGVELYSAAVPKASFVINDLNNSFVYKHDTTSSLIELPIGDFDSRILTQIIGQKLREVGGPDARVTEENPQTPEAQAFDR